MEVIDLTMRDFPELTSAISNAFDVTAFTLRKTSEQSMNSRSYKKGILNIIAYDCFDTISAAYRLTISGYYESGVKLLRSAFESCLLLAMFGLFNERAFEMDKDHELFQEFLSAGNVKVINKKLKAAHQVTRERFLFNLWLDTNEENDTKKKQLISTYFGPTKMMENTKSSEEAYEEDKKCYHRLSQFSHPHFYGLIARLQQDPGAVRYGCIYDSYHALPRLKDIFKIIIKLSNELRTSFDVLDINEGEFAQLDRMNKEYEKYV